MPAEKLNFHNRTTRLSMRHGLIVLLRWLWPLVHDAFPVSYSELPAASAPWPWNQSLPLIPFVFLRSLPVQLRLAFAL